MMTFVVFGEGRKSGYYVSNFKRTHDYSHIRLDLLWFTQVLFLIGGSPAFGADEARLVDERSISVEIFFE